MEKQGDTFWGRQDVQCATECTGLIPAAPQDADEEANETALMAIHDTHSDRKPRPQA